MAHRFARALCLVAMVTLGVSGGVFAIAQEATPEPPQQQAPAPEPPSPTPAEDAPAAQPEQPPAEAAPARKWISGEINAGFDGIWSDGRREIDLDQTVRLNLEIPGYEKLHVRSLFWLREDIDSDNDRDNPLRDLDDNEGSDIDADAVYLHLDIDDLWGDSVLRIGRQRIQEGPSFARIDGLYFKRNMGNWNWYVFGGWQASLYDQSFDDPAAGGGVSWQVTRKTRIALDAYWLAEDRIHYTHYYRPRLSDLLYRDYPRGTDYEVEDSVVSLSIWQVITPNLRLMARLDLHDASSSELTLQATGLIPAWQLSYEITYRKLFNDLGDRASDLTSYHRILGAEEEYDDILVVLHRPLSAKITLSLEGELRNSDNDYPEWGRSYWDQDYIFSDKANQDFKRYAVSLTGRDLVWGLSANTSFEYWDVDNFENSWNVGGELSKTWDALTLTFGVEYSRYQSLDTVYNIWPYARNQFRRALSTAFGGNTSSLNSFYYDNNFTVNLRDVKPVQYSDDIYAIYLEGKWALSEQQRVSLGVTYEDDDTDESPYWRVQAGYTIKF